MPLGEYLPSEFDHQECIFHENRTVNYMNKRTSMFLLINFGKYISNCYWVSKMIHVVWFSWYQMIYPVWTRRGLIPALQTVRVDLWVTGEHTFLRSLPSAVKMAVPGHHKSRSTEKYYLYYVKDLYINEKCDIFGE